MTAITLIPAPGHRAPLENTMRYTIAFHGCPVGELYYNTTGYVGSLPTPSGAFLAVPESALSNWKREIARLNREFREKAQDAAAYAVVKEMILERFYRTTISGIVSHSQARRNISERLLKVIPIATLSSYQYASMSNNELADLAASLGV